jgi:bifunctional UDP-N-acetylglucosamine pyrophosphorylase/glucosamine-1-phosphate N-acetyltransferase
LNKSSEKIALILAAGKGKRMKSDLPKVLHKLDGRYVVDHVIESARRAGIERHILVIGYQADKVEEALKDRGVEFVLQAKQSGTGHAVMRAEPLLAGFDGDLVVLCGDMPLVRPETIKSLIEERHRLNASAVVLTAILENPSRYGRIVRDEHGFLQAIIEYRDADNDIRKIKEVNTSTYCFDWKKLKPILGRLDDKNDQREYYLTDSIAILVNSGRKVEALVAADPAEGLGINSADELLAVEKLLKSGTR